MTRTYDRNDKKFRVQAHWGNGVVYTINELKREFKIQ